METRLAALQQFVAGCRTIAKGMSDHASPRESFAALADGLSVVSQQLAEIDRSTKLAQFHEIIHHSGRGDTALGILPEADGYSRGIAAADLSNALDGLSETIVTIAGGPPNAFKRFGAVNQETRWAAPVRAKMTQVALDLFTSAITIRDDFGLSPAIESLEFSFPGTGRGCCESHAPKKTETLPIDRATPHLAMQEPPRYQLRHSTLMLVAKSIAEMFDETAGGFDQFHSGYRSGWGWPCEDDCTCAGNPTLISATIDKASATAAGGGALQPQITINWSYCCTVQFPMNARGAPARVGQTHSSDEVTDFLRHRWTAFAMATLPSPEEPESHAMPGNDGFRLDDKKRGSPAGPQP